MNRDRSDGLLSLILVVKTEASITSMTLLTHMLICTNTVSCLKMNWNLDALFFRLKTVCNKKKSIFVGENYLPSFCA